MKKRILMTIVILVLILLGYCLIEKIIRCDNDGLTREAAVKIAEKKLNADFKNLSFTLKDAKFQDYDKVWILFYYFGDCSVDICVDKCGVSDICGLSKGCSPFQKR